MHQIITSPNPSLPVRQAGLLRRGSTFHGWLPATEWLLAAVVFLIPWQARWIWQPGFLNGAFWEYGTFSLYALEAVVWACLLGAVWQIVGQRFAWPKVHLRRFLSPSGAVLAGLFGLVALSWLSLLWAPDSALALQSTFRLTESVALMVVLLNASSHGQFRVMVAWGVSAALQGVLAVGQFFTQTVGGSTALGVDPQFAGELGASVIELSDGGRWLRAYGTLPHPNLLAGFLVLGIMCAGAWYVHRYQTFQRVAALLCALLASVGLLFSFSRSGAAALLAGFAVWLILAVCRRQALPALRFIGLTALVAIVAAMWVLPHVGTRLSGVGRLEVKSLVERRSLLHEGLVSAQRSLPLGVGIGQATIASYRQDPGRPGWEYQPPHNVVLLALVELGVDGVLLLFLFAVGAMVLAVRSSAGFGMLVVVVVIGWFDHYLWTLLPGMLMAWLAAGVVLTLSPEE